MAGKVNVDLEHVNKEEKDRCSKGECELTRITKRLLKRLFTPDGSKKPRCKAPKS